MDNEIIGSIRIISNADESFLVSLNPYKVSGGSVPTPTFGSRDELNIFLTEEVGIPGPIDPQINEYDGVILTYSRARELGLIE